MPGPRDGQPEYLFRFRALPDGVPVAIRLRQLLKIALRAFRLRCLSVEEVPAGKPGERGIPEPGKAGGSGI